MSDTISIFNDGSLRDPKRYQVLRLLYQAHLGLGRRAPNNVFMPKSMAHVLRQTCKVYGGIFGLIEKVTQGQDVTESHGRYTGAIKPLEDILLALRESIRGVPQKRINALISDECGETGSIPAIIRGILDRLEGIKSLLVKTVQNLSRDEKLKEVKAPVDVSLLGFDEEFISYIIDLGEMNVVDLGLTEEEFAELLSILNDIKEKYGTAMKDTKNLNINLVVTNIVTVNMTVYINSRTPGGREKLKSSKFWSRVKNFFKKAKDVLNVPITQETTAEFKADFDDLKDIIILETKKPALDPRLFEDLAAQLPTVQRSFYLQSLLFVHLLGKHFEVWKVRSSSSEGYDSMVRKLTSTASATEVALRNARDTQLEKLEDESAHKHSSESIFKTAHDRLTELLREAKDDIEKHAQSFSLARSDDWQAVRDLKSIMEDNW